MIYRAGGNYASVVYGVYAHNGGWVHLKSAAEATNLKAAGVKEVWLEPLTLTNLIIDGQS